MNADKSLARQDRIEALGVRRWAAFAPADSNPRVLGTVLASLALLYVPTWWDLSQTIWQSPDQSQGPLMLLASLWLLFDRRRAIAALPSRPNTALGGGLLALGLLLYVVGRSQSIWLFEVGSQIPVFAAALLLFKGTAALRVAWFPILFLVFMVPLPGPLVAALTGPLKAGVSYVAAEWLFAMGYPISRAGVILTVGPYLILVADACAGLTSMFSLEAVGLLYLNTVRHASPLRNGLLAALVFPIAFCANVVRVVVLVLVTYHLGDAAGQGFLHTFAGLLLFLVALGMIVVVDAVSGGFKRSRSASGAIPHARPDSDPRSASNDPVSASRPRRRALAFLAASTASGVAAIALVPRASADDLPTLAPLDTLFPPAFAGWTIDPSVMPLAPGADLRKLLARTYDQTLARTYVDTSSGYRIMLSVAYGGRRNQGMDDHRPEVCYPAQGLAVRRETGDAMLQLDNDRLPLKRLVAGTGSRNEPITYWLVIGRGLASFGYGHRWALLKYGLTGRVPDGLLVRVSSIDTDVASAFAEQDAFLRDLLPALAPDFRRRVLGQA